MKKVLLLIVGVFSFTSVNAQKFEIGGQLGYGVSNIYGNVNGEAINARSKGGFHIGALGQYNFAERWSLVAKVHYDQKGYKYSDGTSGEELTTYIDVPVMAKWYFGGGDVKGYLDFGPYVGFLMSAKGEDENGSSVDTKDAYNTTDFGLAYGIGVDFPIADNLKLFAELEMNSGVSAVNKNSEIDLRNGATKFGVGVRYSLN